MGCPTRVLLDVSPLTRRVEDRTGLARVAWELFTALSRRQDLDVRTCAWGSLKASRELRELAAADPRVRAVATDSGWAERLYERWARLGELRSSSPLMANISHRLGQALNVMRNPLRGTSIADFDVVHSTYARFPRVVRFAKAATVITVHDLIPLRRPLAEVGSAQRAITRRIIESIRPEDYVACVSEATRRDFLDYTRHPAERTVVIHNGVDHAVFQPVRDHAAVKQVRDRFGLGEEPFVLTASSLAPHKNLGVVIDAWRAVPATGRGRLVIVGGKSAGVDAIRSHLGLSDADATVVVTGFVTDDEFRALASGCNAFLFPSLHEGFGLPVLEAMAVGAPVIASNATSLPEVVGDAGTLLDPGDLDAWRSAIAGAVSLPPRSHPYEPAVARARLYSWDRTAERYADLYRRAAGEVGRGAEN